MFVEIKLSKLVGFTMRLTRKVGVTNARVRQNFSIVWCLLKVHELEITYDDIRARLGIDMKRSFCVKLGGIVEIRFGCRFF